MRELATSNFTGDAAPRPEPALPFVQEVLARLRECRVPYCVLRNYQSLPQRLSDTDLDLLVNAEDLEATFRVLGAAAPRHGGTFISRYRAEALITSLCGRTAGGWWGVKIERLSRSDTPQGALLRCPRPASAGAGLAWHTCGSRR